MVNGWSGKIATAALRDTLPREIIAWNLDSPGVLPLPQRGTLRAFTRDNRELLPDGSLRGLSAADWQRRAAEREKAADSASTAAKALP